MSANLIGPWMIDYTFKGTPVRLILGTENNADPNRQLSLARREVNSLEGVKDPDDFRTKALQIFKDHGFVLVD